MTIYVTRTMLAATTAVIAAKVAFPEYYSMRLSIKGEKEAKQTVPYIFKRGIVRGQRQYAKRQTEDDELEEHPARCSLSDRQ